MSITSNAKKEKLKIALVKATGISILIGCLLVFRYIFDVIVGIIGLNESQWYEPFRASFFLLGGMIVGYAVFGSISKITRRIKEKGNAAA